MAIDLTPIWDFARPDVSEQRLRAALANVTGDDALILRTQIARTHGLRRDFERARRMLRDIETAATTAGPEVRVRVQLELGRTFASAAHAEHLLTTEARERARASYGRALELARTAELDELAIDAVHMLAFVDAAPADQLRWGEAALGIALSSRQPQARAWEASIRNNVGYALHQLGRYDEALSRFQQALTIREGGANTEATRVARWMVAWALRSLGRVEEALRMQVALEAEADAAGQPDPYVFEELEALYQTMGDVPRARHYAERTAAARRGEASS